MKNRYLLIMVLGILFLGRGDNYAATICTSDLVSFGQPTTNEVRKERINYLKNWKTKKMHGDPTYYEIIETLNAQLAEDKADFRVPIYFTKSSEEWWKAARNIRLSQSYEITSRDVTQRRIYLDNVSAWELLRLVSLGWGTPDPLFFESATILSPEVGFLPVPLKEHLPERK